MQSPFIQVRGQTFAHRFPRIETENPGRIGQACIVSSACAGNGCDDAGAIVARDCDGLIARAVVYNEDVVAGIDGLEATAEPEGVVFGMEQCGDWRHEGKSVRETGVSCGA